MVTTFFDTPCKQPLPLLFRAFLSSYFKKGASFPFRCSRLEWLQRVRALSYLNGVPVLHPECRALSEHRAASPHWRWVNDAGVARSTSLQHQCSALPVPTAGGWHWEISAPRQRGDLQLGAWKGWGLRVVGMDW